MILLLFLLRLLVLLIMFFQIKFLLFVRTYLIVLILILLCVLFSLTMPLYPFHGLLFLAFLLLNNLYLFRLSVVFKTFPCYQRSFLLLTGRLFNRIFTIFFKVTLLQTNYSLGLSLLLMLQFCNNVTLLTSLFKMLMLISIGILIKCLNIFNLGLTLIFSCFYILFKLPVGSMVLLVFNTRLFLINIVMLLETKSVRTCILWKTCAFTSLLNFINY